MRHWSKTGTAYAAIFHTDVLLQHVHNCTAPWVSKTNNSDVFILEKFRFNSLYDILFNVYTIVYYVFQVYTLCSNIKYFLGWQVYRSRIATATCATYFLFNNNGDVDIEYLPNQSDNIMTDSGEN